MTIVTAGPVRSPSLPREPGFVIAADGGATTAIRAGLAPDLVIGDLDSLTASELARLEGRRVPLERHVAEKDETDFELALDAAFARRPDRLFVVGSDGGRLDHLFAQLTTLAARTPVGVEATALLGTVTAHIVRGDRTLTGDEGELVSLFAVGGDAEGVRTSGLRYPLRGETLRAGTSRGVSNEFTSQRAQLSVERGVLLVIRPGMT